MMVVSWGVGLRFLTNTPCTCQGGNCRTVMIANISPVGATPLPTPIHPPTLLYFVCLIVSFRLCFTFFHYILSSLDISLVIVLNNNAQPYCIDCIANTCPLTHAICHAGRQTFWGNSQHAEVCSEKTHTTSPLYTLIITPSIPPSPGTLIVLSISRQKSPVMFSTSTTTCRSI